MKAAVFLIFCFINFVFGLKCFSSVGKNVYGNKQCASTDKYCAKMSIYDSYHLPQDFPKFFQGCSYELKEIYNVNCDGYGSFRVGNEIGISEWHGNLFCCPSNICNSANTGMIFVTVIFVIFVNFFILVLQN